MIDGYLSYQRFETLRRELERLHGQHSLRLGEAEAAIANGTITASSLQEEVRRAIWPEATCLHATCTPPARHFARHLGWRLLGHLRAHFRVRDRGSG